MSPRRGAGDEKGADALTRAHGHLRIEHGRHPVARLLARVLRLPAADAHADTRLVITRHAEGEEWLRTFGGRQLRTLQFHVDESTMAERYGVLEFLFHVQTPNGTCVYQQREVALRIGALRVRIPAAIAPRLDAREDPAGSQRRHIKVVVTLPIVGPLISYEGIVEFEDVPV